MIDEKRLRELAEAYPDETRAMTDEMAGRMYEWQRATKPRHVLALLDRITSLSKEVERLTRAFDAERVEVIERGEACNKVIAERDSALAEVERLRHLVGTDRCAEDLLEKLRMERAENTRLESEVERLNQKLVDAETDLNSYDQQTVSLTAETTRLKQALGEAENHRGQCIAALGTSHRKLTYLLRDYPDEKETRALLGRIEELTLSGAAAPQPDDPNRCAVCGWQMADPVNDTAGYPCRPGDCSQRPRPERLYAPERAAKEATTKEHGHNGE